MKAKFVCTCVHGYTTNLWPLAKPSRTTSLSQRCKMRLRVAGNSNGTTGIWADLSKFATLQAYCNAFDVNGLAFFGHPLHLFLCHDDSICACAPTKHTPAFGLGAHIEDLGTKRYHVNRQTIASRRRLGRQHTRIDNATHALQQVLRDTRPVALHLITRPQTVGSNNVCLFASLDAGDEGQMGAAVGVVLDAVHDMLAWEVALVVDYPDTPLVTATSVSHSDLAGVVSAAQMLSLACNGKLEMRSPLPEVVVDRPLQMAQTRSAWLVCAQGDELISSGSFILQQAAIDIDSGLQGGRGCMFNGGGISACRSKQDPRNSCRVEAAYPGLQHGVLSSGLDGDGMKRRRQWSAMGLVGDGQCYDATGGRRAPENPRSGSGLAVSR